VVAWPEATGDGVHADLHGLDAVWNIVRVDLERVRVDSLAHGSDQRQVLDAPLARVAEAQQHYPLAQRRQGGKNGVRGLIQCELAARGETPSSGTVERQLPLSCVTRNHSQMYNASIRKLVGCKGHSNSLWNTDRKESFNVLAFHIS